MTDSSNEEVLLPGRGAPASAEAWHYAVDGQRMGPVTPEQLAAMLAGGQIGPHTPVWRAGMADWLPASQVGELAARAPAVPPPMTSPVPRPKSADRIIRNAKHNCIALFVIFVAFLALTTVGAVASYGHRTALGPGVAPLGCFGWIAPFAAIFAAIYLPLRWRVIMQLSPVVRTLGLIGGFGLIGLFALGLLASLFLA